MQIKVGTLGEIFKIPFNQQSYISFGFDQRLCYVSIKVVISPICLTRCPLNIMTRASLIIWGKVCFVFSWDTILPGFIHWMRSC